MPHIKIFVKEELKFRKQENDLDNSNIETIKSLEKEFGFLKREFFNKNKTYRTVYAQKYSTIAKITVMVTISILILTCQL